MTVNFCHAIHKPLFVSQPVNQTLFRSFQLSISMFLFPTLQTLLSSFPLMILSTPDNNLQLPFRSGEGKFEAVLRVAVWVFITFIIQTPRSED